MVWEYIIGGLVMIFIIFLWEELKIYFEKQRSEIKQKELEKNPPRKPVEELNELMNVIDKIKKEK